MFASANNIVMLVDNFIDRLLSRVFKKDYPFQPIILQEEIKKAIIASVKGFDDGGVLVPDHIHVGMNDLDYVETQKMGKIFHQKVTESATKFIQSEFPTAIANTSRLNISFSASEDIKKGGFVITAEYIDEKLPEPETGGLEA